MSQAPVLIQDLLSRDDGALRGSTGHESPLETGATPVPSHTERKTRFKNKQTELTAGASKGVRPQEHASSTPGACI